MVNLVIFSKCKIHIDITLFNICWNHVHFKEANFNKCWMSTWILDFVKITVRMIYWRLSDRPRKLATIPPIYLNSIFSILQFEISSLINWVKKNRVQTQVDFFPVQTWFFFSSFWARVKCFDGLCLTIYPPSTLHREIEVETLEIPSLFTLIWHF